ncbi:MAG: ABC transporter ATP-binding protein [Tissierellia bacterium]|nr:ABC transporter ATP-binding protein [Tissierellia bacterium]
MAILQVKKLHFSYGKNKVLEGIDLTIDENMMVGIIGGNGSGKSTLLKNISGYLKPDSGNVFIGNRNIKDFSIKEKARHIAYVPQEIPFDFEFSCYDLVMMGRMPYLKRFEKEGEKDKTIVREAMEITNTWIFKEKSINALSGGERQRVYIARALAQRPHILLMDEPVSHLDIKYQIEILTLAKELSFKGMLVIAVLHDINLACQFCDQILIMKEGKIMAAGTPKKILNTDNIKSAFSVDVELLENPITHIPYVVPRLNKRKKFKIV